MSTGTQYSPILGGGAPGPMLRTFACRLKPIDIKFMRSLHDKVNIVPVIAKADTLTKSEIRSLKARVGYVNITARNIGTKRIFY